MDGTGFSFPLPSQIEDVPGAEGWRSMYQYFTRFQPEDDNRFWFNNAMHFPEPLPAFDVLTCEIPYAAIGANTARIFAFPTTLGIEHRILNGRVYITAIPVTDPAEIERRLTGCRVRLVGKPSLDALRAAGRRIGVRPADLAVVGDDPDLEVPMAHRGRALAVAVTSGLGDAGSFRHLPRDRWPHLHLRGVDELLSVCRQARGSQASAPVPAPKSSDSSGTLLPPLTTAGFRRCRSESG